ncbi:MAG: helix-turn-helix transcriptional regulator [Candidatus Flemingibacterium sp.]|nr:helix-turn-helix transcriptional regulator [Candidatus Flemingibacterium sp.]
MEQQNTDPGARLTELRKKRGMTQKSLGTALNISEQAVSKWERGTTMPDIALLPAIAEILSTSIDYILTGKENVRYVTVSQYDMCRTDKRMGREKPLIPETTMIRQFHKARKHPGNPIFFPETPLEKGENGHVAMAAPFSDGVWYDPTDGKTKMWYHAGWFDGTAYAESADGIHFERVDCGRATSTGAYRNARVCGGTAVRSCSTDITRARDRTICSCSTATARTISRRSGTRRTGSAGRRPRTPETSATARPSSTTRSEESGSTVCEPASESSASAREATSRRTRSRMARRSPTRYRGSGATGSTRFTRR